MTRIAVVVPVGPEKHHADYLDEALDSVAAQTRQPDWIVIMDDMHGRDLADRVLFRLPKSLAGSLCVYSPYWRLGVGSAFNHGVAIALTDCDLALMLGADDKLEPRVLEHLEATYERGGKAEGYYWFDTVYESGEEQGLPCGNAAMTAGFLRESGGFPIEASSGGMDAALVSAMLVHRPDYLYRVQGNQGRFWGRQHEGQESRRLGIYHSVMDTIRGGYTQAWQPTNWGRYS